MKYLIEDSAEQRDSYDLKLKTLKHEYDNLKKIRKQTFHSTSWLTKSEALKVDLEFLNSILTKHGFEGRREGEDDE